MVDVPGQITHGSERQAAVRYFLRASRASQMKNPTVKAAKPKNATSCSTLALASENPVSASMVRPPQPVTVRITFMTSSKPKNVRLMTATPKIILTPSITLISA
jgi:hypothetical protein